MNAERYRHILCPQLQKPHLRGRDVYCHQNGVTTHTSRESVQWFDAREMFFLWDISNISQIERGNKGRSGCNRWRGLLERVKASFLQTLETCIQENGRQLPEVIFKTLSLFQMALC